VTVNLHAADRFGPKGTPRVVIVGAGFGGLAAGVKLRNAGIDTFTIIESSAGVGGTWWDNRYPGVEVDVESHLYSYAFKHHDWTRTHAGQAELQAYLEEVVDEYDLRRNLRLNTFVDEAVWDERTHEWTVRLGSGEELVCHMLISAVGFLNEPRYPDWPGLDDFAGPKFHTARWEPEHDLSGKRVGVVGTGSSAVQVVPEIAKVAEKLYVFQRDPGWIMPKRERDFTPEERAALRRPLNRWKYRLKNLWLLEKGVIGGALYRPGTKVNAAREAMARAYIERELADYPELKEAVTPKYPYPGKRPVFASTFYPALKRPNVELVPRAVEKVTERGLVDVDGVEREIDVLVLCTGFHAAEYLPRLRVVGRDGIELHDFWKGEPFAFLGMTVPGYPNFVIMYGPNTNGGEIVSNLERQAEYAVRMVQRLRYEDVTAIEVRPSVCRWYNEWLQRKMIGTSWTTTHTYFVSATGRVVTQWPYGAAIYGLFTKLFGRIAETTRRLHEPVASQCVRAGQGQDRRSRGGVGIDRFLPLYRVPDRECPAKDVDP
jgi:cation diffusion facilitator CzcD-associated flavoprotein CzcO